MLEQDETNTRKRAPEKAQEISINAKTFSFIHRNPIKSQNWKLQHVHKVGIE